MLACLLISKSESWETVYNVRSDYEQFVTHWRRNGLTQSSNVTFELGHATAELSFLSAYLRGHTMEAIRQARPHEGSTSSITADNDKFLATLTRAKDHLGKAKQYAQNIRDQTQSLSAVLADIDNGFLVPFFGNLVTWTNATNAQITALQNRPPTPQFKVKVQSRNITVPSQCTIGAPKLRPWSELWCHPHQKFAINILTTTRIILINYQIVVYTYLNFYKSSLVPSLNILLP